MGASALKIMITTELSDDEMLLTLTNSNGPTVMKCSAIVQFSCDGCYFLGSGLSGPICECNHVHNYLCMPMNRKDGQAVIWMRV